MNHRLLVGRAASELRRERAVLAALAAPLVDPQTLDPGTLCVYCHHPLGAHEWPGDKCNFAGCHCRLFVVPKGGPVDTPQEHDPFADLEEPPADPLADMDEPPDDGQADPEAEPSDPPEDHRPEIKTRLDDSGIFGQPVEIVRRAGTSPLRGRPLDDNGGIAFEVVAPSTSTPYDALSRPVGAPESDAAAEVTETSVRFPVLLQGQSGLPIDRLAEPARRVAEIVEALEPVLLPPPVVAGLEELLARAAAIVVVTNAEEHQRACEVYEELAANGKGLEQTVGPVKAFFHRPWKTVCNFMAKFEPRIEAEKQRLSPLAGAWKKAEEERAERAAREEAEAAAAEERRQLEADAERARAAAAQLAIEKGPDAPEATKLDHVAAILEHAATQVQPVTMPTRSAVWGSSGTKGKTKWVGRIVDEDLFYKGLGNGTIPRTFVEVKQGTLDSQATDLKTELEKRYPGLRAVEVPGIASKGRR